MSHTLKFFILIVILLALVFGIGILSQGILSRSSIELGKEIVKVEENITANDWISATQCIKEVREKWDVTKKTWAVLIDHFEIDNIDITMTRVEQYIRCEDASSGLAEASALHKYVRHIPHKEILNLENIF